MWKMPVMADVESSLNPAALNPLLERDMTISIVAGPRYVHLCSRCITRVRDLVPKGRKMDPSSGSSALSLSPFSPEQRSLLKNTMDIIDASTPFVTPLVYFRQAWVGSRASNRHL